MALIQDPGTMEMVDVPEGGHFVNLGGDNGWQLQFDQGTHSVSTGTEDNATKQVANLSANQLSSAQSPFSGLQSAGANSWFSPEGGIINLDPQTGATTYSPPASDYKTITRFGQNYGVANDPNASYSYNGQNITYSPTTAQIDPNTGKVLTDANGQPIYAPIDSGEAGNFWNENMMGALKVGAFGAGAYGLDALAGGLAAEGAGGAYGGMDAYANAALGGSGGTFVPAEGFSATLPSFSSAAPIGDQIGDYPMPGENGTASQWTPSKINPNDVSNLLDYNAAYANTGMSVADALKYANQAKQVYGAGNTLAQLLSSPKTGGISGSVNNGVSGSVNPQQLGSLLAGGAPQSSNFIGQIKANQNPFLFTSPGQTQASEGMYDVSGSNLANALRKA